MLPSNALGEIPGGAWVMPCLLSQNTSDQFLFKLQAGGVWISVHFSITSGWLGVGDDSAEGVGGLCQDGGAVLHGLRSCKGPLPGFSSLVWGRSLPMMGFRWFSSLEWP